MHRGFDISPFTFHSLIKVPNAQVSDTTGDAICTTACSQKNSNLMRNEIDQSFFLKSPRFHASMNSAHANGLKRLMGGC